MKVSVRWKGRREREGERGMNERGSGSEGSFERLDRELGVALAKEEPHIDVSKSAEHEREAW